MTRSVLACLLGWALLGAAGCGDDSSSGKDAGSDGGSDVVMDAAVDGEAGTGGNEIIEFVPADGGVPYALGSNPYGLTGTAFLTRSTLGNSTLTLGNQPGKLCVKGSLDVVPTPADGSHPPYGDYWGFQIGFNLNGGQAWMPGSVTGFSFVLEGASLPMLRFKMLPFGLDPAAEGSDKCKEIYPLSGATTKVLFSELTQYCWSPGNPVIDTSQGLVNFSVQVPANTNGPVAFDWCLRDLRAIVK